MLILEFNRPTRQLVRSWSASTLRGLARSRTFTPKLAVWQSLRRRSTAAAHTRHQASSVYLERTRPPPQVRRVQVSTANLVRKNVATRLVIARATKSSAVATMTSVSVATAQRTSTRNAVVATKIQPSVPARSRSVHVRAEAVVKTADHVDTVPTSPSETFSPRRHELDWEA